MFDTTYEITVEGHAEYETATHFAAYAIANELVQDGHSPTIIHRGPCGHSRLIPWAELAAEYR
jgi:hypothetical protein